MDPHPLRIVGEYATHAGAASARRLLLGHAVRPAQARILVPLPEGELDGTRDDGAAVMREILGDALLGAAIGGGLALLAVIAGALVPGSPTADGWVVAAWQVGLGAAFGIPLGAVIGTLPVPRVRGPDVRSALARGRYVLVVHTRDAAQAAAVRTLLDRATQPDEARLPDARSAHLQ